MLDSFLRAVVSQCIDKWLLTKRSCVLCQQNIDTATNVKMHSGEVAAGEVQPLTASGAGEAEAGASRSSRSARGGGGSARSPAAVTDAVSLQREGGGASFREPEEEAAAVALAAAAAGSSPRSHRGSRSQKQQAVSPPRTDQQLAVPAVLVSESSPRHSRNGIGASGVMILHDVPLNSSPVRTCAPGVCNESKEEIERDEQQQQQQEQALVQAQATAAAAGSQPQHRPSISHSISGSRPSTSARSSLHFHSTLQQSLEHRDP